MPSTDDRTHLTDSLGVDGLIRLAVDRIREATEQWKPVYMSGAFSGGGDSIAACYVTSLAPNFRSMFHCDTGVGLRATEEYVAETCRSQLWPLETFKALDNERADGTPDPQDYFAMVEHRGFPGPAMHWKMYQRLKQRQIEAWSRAHKRWRSREKVMLISGRRVQESERRKRTTARLELDPSCKRLVWCNPLFDASKLDCHRIREHAGLPKSPVVHLIHMSGECLCSSYGSPEELVELKMWFGDDPTVKRIVEADAREKARGRWGWGCGGPPNKKACAIRAAGPMCANCDAKNAADDPGQTVK